MHFVYTKETKWLNPHAKKHEAYNFVSMILNKQ